MLRTNGIHLAAAAVKLLVDSNELGSVPLTGHAFSVVDGTRDSISIHLHANQQDRFDASSDVMVLRPGADDEFFSVEVTVREEPTPWSRPDDRPLRTSVAQFLTREGAETLRDQLTAALALAPADA
jgi:hypothetical protein